MNLCTPFACLSLLLACATATAQEDRSLTAIAVQGIYHVADCDKRVLPSQRLVGEWTGQANFGQVYATRQRLMGEIGRACQRPGVEQVNLVMERSPAPYTMPARLVARAAPVGRR